MDQNDYYSEAKRVTLIGALVNILLAVVKLFVGWFARSHALFADGLHSLSDVVSDFCVLFATRYGSRQADEDHPYGHAKIETVAVVGLALLVSFAGIAIIVDGLDHLLNIDGAMTPPGSITLWVAVISVLVNEALFRYMMSVGKKIDSALLQANAWHNRSDAATSIVVLIGIGGSLLGYPYLDAIASIIVGFFIIKMGCWDLGWAGLRELVDTGLDKEQCDRIREVILQVPGVTSIHQLRTRSMGGRVYLDVHVLVDPYLSVSEGHYVGEQVQTILVDKMAQVMDVTVHVDPEDDEYDEPNKNLPPRDQVVAELSKCWKDLPGYTEAQIRLHYLSGCLQIELLLPFAYSQENVEQLLQDYRTNLQRSTIAQKLFIHFVA